jgi:hypothetical protein
MSSEFRKGASLFVSSLEDLCIHWWQENTQWLQIQAAGNPAHLFSKRKRANCKRDPFRDHPSSKTLKYSKSSYIYFWDPKMDQESEGSINVKWYLKSEVLRKEQGWERGWWINSENLLKMKYLLKGTLSMFSFTLYLSVFFF